ncbi:MAG: DNA repair exonuclease [Pirellulales bacterium]
MTSFRFVHAADVHLDSPLRGLEAYAGAPVERLRNATRRALDNVISLCVEQQVDLLVIAGDLFDTECRDFQSALAAAAQLQKLNRAGIPVYLILGNHDSFFERSRNIPWPSNVTVFDHRRPETVLHPRLPIALHGMSYPKREVTHNLVPDYPAPLPDHFNIGLLHTNAGGNPNHDAYAPCKVEELAAKGYDYWALGHVHDYQVLHDDPPVVYSGNVQGRHARELGRKGCVLVEVDADRAAKLEFCETDVMRWAHCRIELNEEDREEELLEKTRVELDQVLAQTGGKPAAVRLTYSGRTQLHRLWARDHQREQILTNIRALAGDWGDDLWIEKIRLKTQSPIDMDALRRGDDLVGQLLRDIQSIVQNPSLMNEVTEWIGPLLTRVAGEIAHDGLDEAISGSSVSATMSCVAESAEDTVDTSDLPVDVDQMRAWLVEAEELLLSYLVEDRP